MKILMLCLKPTLSMLLWRLHWSVSHFYETSCASTLMLNNIHIGSAISAWSYIKYWLAIGMSEKCRIGATLDSLMQKWSGFDLPAVDRAWSWAYNYARAHYSFQQFQKESPISYSHSVPNIPILFLWQELWLYYIIVFMTLLNVISDM